MAEENTDYGSQYGRYRAKTVMAMASVRAKQKRTIANIIYLWLPTCESRRLAKPGRCSIFVLKEI